MITITYNHISSMLNELLDKALNEKPLSISEEYLTYDKIRVEKDGKFISILLIRHLNNKEEWLIYPYELTREQKEKINNLWSKWGNNMQTIIQNKLSSMLDELLQKALEEKPKIKTTKSFVYDYFKVYQEDEYHEISILTRKNNPESMGMYIPYFYDLTDKQKELINKVFDKWGNNNEG